MQFVAVEAKIWWNNKGSSFYETRCTLPKNVTTLSCYNSDIHESMLIFLAQMLLRKLAIRRYFIFPPHLASASALPGETRNPKPGNCVISLKCCMLFTENTRNTFKNITWSQLNHPLLWKWSTVCTRQDLGRNTNDVGWENKVPFDCLFLSNICAENYQNQLPYVRVMARQSM